MSRNRRNGTLFLLCAGLGAPSIAADYGVSGSGDDGAAGTSIATAFRSLNKAASLVDPGDTVWLLNGSYGA